MNRKLILLLGMILFFLVTGTAAGFIFTVAKSPPVVYIVMATSLALGVILGINIVRETLRDTKSRTETQDSFQASFSRGFRIFPIVVLLLTADCALQLTSLWDHPKDTLRLTTAALVVTINLMVIWFYALMLSGNSRVPNTKRLIQDEFFQNNLAKSRSDGFYALLAMLTLCFIVGLFSARLAVAALPFAAAFGVAFAGWRFNRRDGKALGDDLVK